MRRALAGGAVRRLPDLALILVIGQYAQAWHLGRLEDGLTGTVRRWREILAEPRRPRVLPLPHPSWRNNGWLKREPWFEAELLPVLKAEVTRVLAGEPGAQTPATRLAKDAPAAAAPQEGRLRRGGGLWRSFPLSEPAH